MTLHRTGGRRRSTFATPYDRDSEERQREPIPRALPDVGGMYTICSLFAICSMPRSAMSFLKSSQMTKPICKRQARSNYLRGRRKNVQKTNASPSGEAQVMGGFPKRSDMFIQNLCS